MKTQIQAQQATKRSNIQPGRRQEKTSVYPHANTSQMKAPDYSSMAMEIQKISDPMEFAALKSFYNLF